MLQLHLTYVVSICDQNWSTATWSALSCYLVFSLNSRAASKSLIKMAWRLAVDAQRTLAPLAYPPHEISLACMYVASFLTSLQGVPVAGTDESCRTPQEIATMLATGGSWERQYHAHLEDIDGLITFHTDISHV
jgi:CTD kinase subunit beta